MYYAIQENLFREYGFKALIAHLEKLKSHQWSVNYVDYEIVKYIPFSGEFNVKTDRKDIFVFGSCNVGKVIEGKGWKPGHFMNENFTFEKYLSVFGDNLLNSDGEIVEVGRVLPPQYRDMFIRPLTDTKEFTGQIFLKEEWEDYIKGNEEIRRIKVLVASPKTIQQEIRCWIVDGEPVTISQYRIGKRGNYLNMDHNDEAIIFARNMAKIFSPARAYCLDICLHEDEYKIVELGCINHCGFYDANMGKLIDSLENMIL